MLRSIHIFLKLLLDKASSRYVALAASLPLELDGILGFV